MNYSKHHTWFAEYLTEYYSINEQDVLNYPENSLGPNYKEVLNYWVYSESLSDKQWAVYWDRYDNLEEQTRIEALKIAKKFAKEVIDPRFVGFIYSEELELIASHLYIERGIPFTFLPLIFDL